jgi:F0F1-type ATP synthase assembly protein I
MASHPRKTPPETPPGRDKAGAPRRVRDQGSSGLALMGAGLEMAAVVGLLATGGWWLDQRWGTGPWLMVAGLAVGLVGETYKIWRIGRRYFD